MCHRCEQNTAKRNWEPRLERNYTELLSRAQKQRLFNTSLFYFGSENWLDTTWPPSCVCVCLILVSKIAGSHDEAISKRLSDKPYSPKSHWRSQFTEHQNLIGCRCIGQHPLGFHVLKGIYMQIKYYITIHTKCTCKVTWYPSMCSTYCCCPSAICSTASCERVLLNDLFARNAHIVKAIVILLSFNSLQIYSFIYILKDDLIIPFTILPARNLLLHSNHYLFPQNWLISQPHQISPSLFTVDTNTPAPHQTNKKTHPFILPFSVSWKNIVNALTALYYPS